MRKFQIELGLSFVVFNIVMTGCTSATPSLVKALMDSQVLDKDVKTQGSTEAIPLNFKDGANNELQAASTQVNASPNIYGTWKLSEVDCWSVSNKALVVIPAATSGTTDTYDATLVSMPADYTLNLAIARSNMSNTPVAQFPPTHFFYGTTGCRMVYPVSATFPATDQMAIVLGQPSTATGCSPTASGPVSQLTKLGLPISSVLQGTFYYTLDTARLILIKNTSGGGFCSALKNVNGNDVLYFNKL